MRTEEFRKSKTETGDFRKTKIMVILTGVIFVVSVILSAFILRPSRSRQVEIVRDEEVLYTIDLDRAQDQTMIVYYEHGSSNTISIEDGRIRVLEAECPDQTCVRMGYLRSESLPIVCLPNHLIIRFRQ